MAGGSPSDVCLKHNPHWNKRLYWLLNKLYENIIPKEYQKRVGALLCTCERRADLPARNDPFNTVSDNDLMRSVAYMETFLITHNRHGQIDTLNRLMQWFKDEGLIPANTSSADPEACRRSSAYKLLYILQQCFLDNYRFLDPPPPINQPAAVQELTLTFIADCDHNMIGSVIGRNGVKLKPLLRSHKCHIKVDKVNVGNDLKVKVAIRKRTQSMESLERVKTCIEDMVKDVVQDEDHYRESRLRRDELYKADFKKLLKETGLMSRTVSWNEILRNMVGKSNYRLLDRAKGHDALKRWFLDMQFDWQEVPSASGGSAGRAFVGGSSLTVHHNELSDEEPDDTVLKGATASTTTAPPAQRNSTSEPQPSTSALRPEVSSLGATGGATGGARISGDVSQPLSTAQEGRLEPDAKPSLCLVHDRRWTPTYQFTLTRCYTEIKLEKKHGRAFSRFVCSCQYSVPGFLQHFQNESEMKVRFHTVIGKIKDWPVEVETIMLPLIRQLEMGQDSEMWQSLYRFVFLYTKLLDGQTDCLTQSCRLPYGSQDTGAGGIVCQPETNESRDVTRPPSVVTNKTKVTVQERSEECYFHGRKKRGLFQCVVNYLCTAAYLPKRYNIPFCKAVCCCNEDNNFPPVYENVDDLRRACISMKAHLLMWRGVSSVSIQPYIALIQDYLDRKTQLERGFQKFVYYFNCAYKRDYRKFEK